MEPTRLVGGAVWPRFLVESCRPIFEELFLPAVKDRGLQTEFIAELRDGYLLQQTPPQDGQLNRNKFTPVIDRLSQRKY